MDINKNLICPISSSKINETVARINGGLTLLFVVVFLLTGNLYLISFLIVDFLLRSLKKSKYSPFSILSKFIVKTFRLKPRIINAGPKIFAARVGILFSVLIFIFSFIGLNTLAFVFLGVFGFCAFLEFVFGFCVACQIYPFIYKLTYQSDVNTDFKMKSS